MGTSGGTGFAAIAHYQTMSLNNVRRCPAAFMPSQHPLNCPNFRIQHGSGLSAQDCAACTHIVKSFPPHQMRQPPVQVSMPIEGDRYHDEPLPAGLNTAQRESRNVSFVPGLSQQTPSAQAEASAPQTQPDKLVHINNNQPNHAPGRVSITNLGEVIRPRRRMTRDHTSGGNLSTSPTPPVRQRSASRNRHRSPDDSMTTIAQLNSRFLDRAEKANRDLTRENEQLKRENELLKMENSNLKRWVAMNAAQE